MSKPIEILLQTTIPTADDDWDIKRYSLLREYLASLVDAAGNPLVRVAARDRETDHDQHELFQLRLADYPQGLKRKPTCRKHNLPRGYWLRQPFRP